MARRDANAQKQIFSIAAPGAMSVTLAGDFLRWQEKPIPMQKRAGGTRKASVELASEDHRYGFVVDGQWWDDPECTLRLAKFLWLPRCHEASCLTLNDRRPGWVP
ncbi:MAG: glycogen-binding domain-containing protein [Verrucomicrobiota bacterium]|jgi:1,4-alpha-glucan branching enzyme